ncbi:hypothetical protein NQ317_007155 [Molorchus minor]|uniref:Ubiquitin carboxyl-terminal hydrolase n=1 Tax=Molorchus minor TaxID=1323400 RepID=A0ABQ9J6D0_9CUCU|nr:hypothetical protein NQ317_007155 [Molorchus minor]
MCDSGEVIVIKSISSGILNNEMTLIPESNEPSRLKRSFTLPRNPFNTTRMSKRRPKSKENDIDLKIVTNESDMNNKKVFRRPSIRKFINKIAQHIGGVPGINQSIENNRVPPVGLQTWGPDDTPGVTGLKNHGNTCFINAVLQCISHTDVLAEYFVLDRYKIDLSRRNKLNSKKFGTKGEVTEQLALLLKALWACQYSPELSTAFKQVVERHGAQYKGTQQHDALEFLQWLLDKVHEDLNTASKKKFKSIKTSGRPDEVIAAETLENYKRCNNSFIHGVFQAQYRSSLSCSRCRTQSNTFDPFQCISVQLPQFHKHSIYVTKTEYSYNSIEFNKHIMTAVIHEGDVCDTSRRCCTHPNSQDKYKSVSPCHPWLRCPSYATPASLRTFTDTQSVSVITEIDPIYCIEVAQLKDVQEESTSAYVLLCWINVLMDGSDCQKFGSPYTMQVSREISYDDLQKLVLKEMAPVLHDDVLTSSQPRGVSSVECVSPYGVVKRNKYSRCGFRTQPGTITKPPCYLEPELEHPLFMEAVDQALALCSEDGGPPHVKLVLEWTADAKAAIIADDSDFVEEHSSVKMLRAQALYGGAPLTLEECLRDYTEAETLTDAWRCPHCQQYQPVVKTLDVWSLPDILIVHFKRFRQACETGNSTKLTTMVEFPVYGFDMTPHLAHKRNTLNRSDMVTETDGYNSWSPWKRARKPSNSSDNMYDLYAICYHHGTDLETGHYTAACKNPYDNQWYMYDDAKVVNLSKQSDDISSLLVNNSAYILFYQKRNGIYVGSSSNSSSVQYQFRGQQSSFESKDVEDSSKNVEEVVALRNSQNTLHSSSNSVRKSLETKSTNTDVKKSPTPSRLSVNSANVVSEPKKPIYTTSIYINSSGNVDVTTTCNKSPVLSNHRVNGVAQDGVEDSLRENVNVGKNDVIYTTTAAVHRHSDIGTKEPSRTQLNFMSPQPVKKLQTLPQSM